MNSTIFHSLNATPDSRNISEMLTQLAPKLQNIVAQFRHDATTPETTLAFETALETCCREACRGLIEAEYNAIEPATLQDCPLRMRLAGENYKRRPKSPNVIGTLFGPIRLERYRYEALEPGERGICPLEMHLGVEAGLATPALAERIGLHAVDHTQQQVLDWLNRDHGLKWSIESLRK
jgi:hypothetical protein